MKFEIVASISPAAAFGLPDGDTVVVPSGTTVVSGDLTTTADGELIRLSSGTLSKFREKAVHREYSFEVAFTVDDNMARLTVETQSWHEATRTARRVLERLLRQLSIGQRRCFVYRIRLVRDDEGTEYPVPYRREVMTVTSYDTDRLSRDLDDAADAFRIQDERLERSAEYFEHALYLFERRSAIADPMSRHHDLLISSIFLNLWKAVATVVGDPKITKDRYQSRYRRIGLDDELKLGIDGLKKLRDDYDVAHYSLDDDRLSHVEQAFGEGHRVAADVLQRYREHLKKLSTA